MSPAAHASSQRSFAAFSCTDILRLINGAAHRRVITPRLRSNRKHDIVNGYRREDQQDAGDSGAPLYYIEPWSLLSPTACSRQ